MCCQVNMYIELCNTKFSSSPEDRGVVPKEGVSLCWLNSLKVRHLVREERVVPVCMKLLTTDAQYHGGNFHQQKVIIITPVKCNIPAICRITWYELPS